MKERLVLAALVVGLACAVFLAFRLARDGEASTIAAASSTTPARTGSSARRAASRDVPKTAETLAPAIVPSAPITAPPTRTAERFPVGEDWWAHLRRIKKDGGVEALLPALDDWLASLTGADGEPTRASLLVGKLLVEKALDRDADAERDLVDAVAAMVPEPGALLVGRAPMVWNLVPMPRTNALHCPIEQSRCMHVHWGQHLRLYPCEPWLERLSLDDSRRDTAMAASTLRHLLIFTGDLAAPSAGFDGPTLRETLRAQVLARFAASPDERATKIRDFVRTILDSTPR